MDKQEIVTKVVQTLAHVQEVSGRSSAGIADNLSTYVGAEAIAR